MFRFFENIKQRITDWCLSPTHMTLGEIHSSSNPVPCEIYDNDQLKFIEQSTPTNMLVKTPTGFSRVKHSHKTVPYQVWEIHTMSHQLECADRHIVIGEYDQQIYVNQLQVGDLIQTDTGLEPVVHISTLNRNEPMYDLELNDKNHVYYTNGILSHNSTVAAAYLLWFAIFHSDKTVLIVSNKNDNAMEMITRIKFAYENLPDWLKPGIMEDGWNKHAIGLDNGSRIISQATSESSGRGFSISLLFCLGGETPITVRNKETGEIMVVSMEEMYDVLQQNQDPTQL